MLELLEWHAERGLPDRPWLVFGKGPTFSRRAEFDLGSFNTVGLNHVVREQTVDVAHMIDIDVVEACADAIDEGCRWLLMPRVPHVRGRPSHARLEDFFGAIPVLERLAEARRLVWYNAETSPRYGRSPVVEVRYFSSEAVLSVLGILGASTVRTLGIDGGQSYSAAFSAIAAQTRLVNGQPSFDVQFEELDRIAARHGIDLAPLVEPVRVFIGAGPAEELPAQVLAASIRRRSSRPVRVTNLARFSTPVPKDRRNRPRTAFSFTRFLIPALCNFRGRAIYVDSDMLVFADVAELDAVPFGAAAVLCTNQPAPDAWTGNEWFKPGRQLSVMALDCARLAWQIEDIVAELDRGSYRYEDLMFDLCIVPPDQIADALPEGWNHLERYVPGETKLLHYTVVPTQPWKSDAHPLGHLWEEELRRGLAEGSVSPDVLRAAVAAGHVRSSLLPLAELAPPPCTPPASSSAEVELDAMWRHLGEVRRRSLRWRVRQVAKQAAPLVRSSRARSADGPATRILERLADEARRRLR